MIVQILALLLLCLYFQEVLVVLHMHFPHSNYMVLKQENN